MGAMRKWGTGLGRVSDVQQGNGWPQRTKMWQRMAELSRAKHIRSCGPAGSECVAQGSWGSLILRHQEKGWSLGGVQLGVAWARRLRAGRRCHVETHFFSSCSAR